TKSLMAEQDASLEEKIVKRHPYSNHSSTSNRLRKKADELRRDFDALDQKYRQKRKQNNKDLDLDFDL
ncbi:MAG: hypothetical protein AAFO07_33185, partial [Bacteroidota bacterium]